MLTEEQIKAIEEKEDLTFNDLYLLEHHIFEIGKVQDEYGDTLPSDVAINLQADLERIIARLNKHLNERGIYNFHKKSVDNTPE
jgi:hypothetical protein